MDDATGALVLFRYVWSGLGPRPVQLATLLRSIGSLRSYLSEIGGRRPSGVPGHNPLGSISILAMVLALTLQVCTGLFSEDDGLFSAGPLASEVSGATVRLMTRIHNLGAKLILALVALHLIAIAFYLIWKKENLVTPMLTGWKWVRTDKTTK